MKQESLPLQRAQYEQQHIFKSQTSMQNCAQVFVWFRTSGPHIDVFKTKFKAQWGEKLLLCSLSFTQLLFFFFLSEQSPKQPSDIAKAVIIFSCLQNWIQHSLAIFF